MATPKFSGKKTATTTAKRNTAKPSAKATTPRPVAKGFNSMIGDDVKGINKKYGIAAMLPGAIGKTQTANVAPSTNDILMSISEKMDIIIGLLRLEKGV